MGMKGWDWSGQDEERPDWDRLFVGLRDGAFLGAEPGVRKRGMVSINAGWLARGGLLRLYADRLEFEPNPLERLLFARGRVIAFDELDHIERRPDSAELLSVGGEAPRMRLHRHDGGHLDILPAGRTLDAWLLAIRESWTWWSRRGVVAEGDDADI
jgi:hypothetical protein